MNKIAQHGNCAEIAQRRLIFLAAGRQVPERSAGVAHHRQAGRAQVMQQNLETSVPSQSGSVVVASCNVTGDVPHDASPGLDDGQRLRL